MRTRPAAFVALALFAVVVGGCSSYPMPGPSATPTGFGAGGDEEFSIDTIELVSVEINIETIACNALREDCEKPKYVDVTVECEPEGDPVAVPFRDGTLTVEYLGVVMDLDTNQPVDVDLELRIFANDTQDFYGSYGGAGDYYDLAADPYLFTYDHGWTMYWPPAGNDRGLASLTVEQWGGNGRYSIIDINIHDITPGH